MTPERDEFEEALTNWSGDAYLAAIASIGGQQAIDAFVEDIKRVRATHRRALAKARAERDEYYGGILSMTVARLGGKVEGRPTQRDNFLQRVDELRKIEKRAAALDKEVGR